MVDYGSIALNYAVHSQVTAISSISNLPILKRLDGGLDGIDGSTAVFHDEHSQLCGAGVVSVIVHHINVQLHVLIASLKMDPLVLVTVVASTCMHIYAADIDARRTLCSLPRERLVWIGAVDGRILTRGDRHALGCRKALPDGAKSQRNRV
jgi:hypothetical protein